eukprot:TRINITY_DN13980_c0_g1_i1.p1 TRINITY_DN13980_c0_g1~~TRINITY_DN13980_c0_g1_i1.p1  ORF type:complete len:1047 (-),score=343.64 TRINITY_DN13980_c0_g1_i1:141-3281(-)
MSNDILESEIDSLTPQFVATIDSENENPQIQRLRVEFQIEKAEAISSLRQQFMKEKQAALKQMESVRNKALSQSRTARRAAIAAIQSIRPELQRKMGPLTDTCIEKICGIVEVAVDEEVTILRLIDDPCKSCEPLAMEVRKIRTHATSLKKELADWEKKYHKVHKEKTDIEELNRVLKEQAHNLEIEAHLLKERNDRLLRQSSFEKSNSTTPVDEKTEGEKSALEVARNLRIELAEAKEEIVKLEELCEKERLEAQTTLEETVTRISLEEQQLRENALAEMEQRVRGEFKDRMAKEGNNIKASLKSMETQILTDTESKIGSATEKANREALRAAELQKKLEEMEKSMDKIKISNALEIESAVQSARDHERTLRDLTLQKTETAFEKAMKDWHQQVQDWKMETQEVWKQKIQTVRSEATEYENQLQEVTEEKKELELNLSELKEALNVISNSSEEKEKRLADIENKYSSSAQFTEGLQQRLDALREINQRQQTSLKEERAERHNLKVMLEKQRALFKASQRNNNNSENNINNNKTNHMTNHMFPPSPEKSSQELDTFEKLTLGELHWLCSSRGVNYSGTNDVIILRELLKKAIVEGKSRKNSSPTSESSSNAKPYSFPTSSKPHTATSSTSSTSSYSFTASIPSSTATTSEDNKNNNNKNNNKYQHQQHNNKNENTTTQQSSTQSSKSNSPIMSPKGESNKKWWAGSMPGFRPTEANGRTSSVVTHSNEDIPQETTSSSTNSKSANTNNTSTDNNDKNSNNEGTHYTNHDSIPEEDNHEQEQHDNNKDNIDIDTNNNNNNSSSNTSNDGTRSIPVISISTMSPEKTTKVTREQVMSPDSDNWIQAFTDDGQSYFYHRVTRAVRWEKPSREVRKKMEERIKEETQNVARRQQQRVAELREAAAEKEAAAQEEERTRSSKASIISTWACGKTLREMLVSLPISFPKTASSLQPLPLGATESDIRKSYRKAIRCLHPDKVRSASIEVKVESRLLFSTLTDAHTTFNNSVEAVRQRRASSSVFSHHHTHTSSVFPTRERRASSGGYRTTWR